MFKKFLCFFIIFVLLITPPSRCYAAATAGTLTVAAGSGAAVGGLFSGFGLSSASSAVALTMVLLGSLGATVKLTEEAIQAGKKVQDVIMDKFAQWVGGSSAESMTEDQREELKKRFKVINGGSGNSDSSSDGPNVGPDGKIYFGLGALGILTEFLKFLKSNNDIQDYQESDPDALTTVNLGPYTTVLGDRIYDAGAASGYGTIFDKPCAIFRRVKSDSKTYGWFCISQQPFKYKAEWEGSWHNASFYNGYYNAGERGMEYRDFYPPGAYGLDYDLYYGTIIDQITGWEEQAPVTGVSEDGIYKGDSYDDSILDNPTNPIVVDPGILPNVTPESDQQVSIPDYLQMILDNANANAAQSQDPYNVPVTDPATLSPGTLTVPVQEQDPIDQPLPAETVAPEDVPVNPVQDPLTPADPETAIPELIFPLDEYFPFCIPFDIYALLSKFSADPVAPVFDWSFEEPFSQSNVTVHIDLSMWDSVASAVRVAELGAFIVGLAMISRKIFTRG